MVKLPDVVAWEMVTLGNRAGQERRVGRESQMQGICVASTQTASLASVPSVKFSTWVC